MNYRVFRSCVRITSRFQGSRAVALRAASSSTADGTGVMNCEVFSRMAVETISIESTEFTEKKREISVFSAVSVMKSFKVLKT